MPLAFDSSFPYTCLLLAKTFLRNENYDRNISILASLNIIDKCVTYLHDIVPRRNQKI